MTKVTYALRDEVTGLACGHDYESFEKGWYCEEPARKVIVDSEGFHSAHLCELHAKKVMENLNSASLTKES